MSARGQNWFLRPARRVLGWKAERNLGRLTCPKICQEEQSGAKLSALNPRQQRTTEENRAGSSQEPLIWVIADQSLLRVPGIKYFIFSQSGLHWHRHIGRYGSSIYGPHGICSHKTHRNLNRFLQNLKMLFVKSEKSLLCWSKQIFLQIF